jgi:hypothetical protein
MQFTARTWMRPKESTITNYINVVSNTKPHQDTIRFVNKFTMSIIKREINRAQNLLQEIFEEMTPMSEYEKFLVLLLKGNDPNLVEYNEKMFHLV